MNPWVPFAGALAYNYRRHRRGLPTICSTARRIAPRVILVGGWCWFSHWFIGHILDGYDGYDPKEH